MVYLNFCKNNEVLLCKKIIKTNNRCKKLRNFAFNKFKEREMIKTDIIIIGAGPTGLFTVFEAGLLKLKCHLIDALAQPGGQCSEIYPKKPIYDIPAYPEILAGDLTDKLLEQIKQFEPGFTLGERAEEIIKDKKGVFTVTTNKGTKHQAPVVAIAGGLGSFEPRKPQLENLEKFEDNGIEYIVKLSLIHI